MRCPHCQKETKALVIESRKLEGQVYRRRICGACGTSFVSTEHTSAEMKMPPAIGARNKAARRARLGDQQSAPIRNDGRHLNGIWR